MYSRKPFAIDDLDLLQNFIIENAFATLVVNQGEQINAIHLPFTLDKTIGDKGRLKAHVAKNNVIYNGAVSINEVLIMFLGPHSYVSPAWYPSKKKLW